MDKRKLIIWLLLLLLCFVIHKMTEPRKAQDGSGSAAKISVEQIDYSVVIPPEELPQFKNTDIYLPPAQKKDPLWMNPPDTDLMPPKDPNDPNNGVM